MKINIIKASALVFAAAMLAIPTFAVAQTAPSTGGTGTGGADQAPIAVTTPAPTTGGSTTGGTNANSSTGVTAPTTGGSSTGGTNVNSGTGVTAPSTGGSNAGGTNQNSNSTVTPPSTGGTNAGGTNVNSGTGVTAPSTGGTNGGGTNSGTITPPSTGGTNGGGVDTGTTGSNTNNGGGTNVGGNGVGGGSSGGSSSGSSPLVEGTSTSAFTPTFNCPLISSYMKLGNANNSSDVAKLQAFLKNSQKLDVAVTGTFDEKTEAAVRAFQVKYMSDIMGPWSATQSSGVVYITTVKKINEIACATPFKISADEQSIIDAYKANLSGDQTTGTSTQIGAAQLPGATFDVAQTSDQNPNEAAVAGSSIFSRFWKFLVNLFR